MVSRQSHAALENMDSATSWKALRLGQDTPQLLVKTRFDGNGYQVLLTDLSRVWGENLTKSAIIERAATEGCCIDPSDDDQYEKLLEKIRNALSNSKDTNLRLQSEADNGSLTLETSAPLPAPLPRLKWFINLQRLPDSSVGSELVVSLLLHSCNLQYQVQQLIDELGQKDHVIEKLTDKLVNAGTDLTAVFPSASGIRINRKASQREQFAGYVKALAEFDEDVWRRASAPPHDQVQELSPSILEAALSDVPIINASLGDPGAEEEWWRKLGKPEGTTNRAHFQGEATRRQRNLGGVIKRAEKERNDEGVHGEFQRQSTPPQSVQQKDASTASESEVDTAKDTSRIPESFLDGDASTEEDEDADVDSSRSKTSQILARSPEDKEEPVLSRSVPSLERKLGATGGMKAQGIELEQMPNTTLPTRNDKSRRKSGGKQGGTSDPEDGCNADDFKHSMAKTKSKLGKFGGKAKKSQILPEEEEKPATQTPRPKVKLGAFGGRSKKETIAPAESQYLTSQASPARAPKLGVMGGEPARKPVTPPPVDNVKEERQSRVPEREASVEQDRENSEERANRRRAKLKRELEQKAKVPVMKKRKF